MSIGYNAVYTELYGEKNTISSSEVYVILREWEKFHNSSTTSRDFIMEYGVLRLNPATLRGIGYDGYIIEPTFERIQNDMSKGEAIHYAVEKYKSLVDEQKNPKYTAWESNHPIVTENGIEGCHLASMSHDTSETHKMGGYKAIIATYQPNEGSSDTTKGSRQVYLNIGAYYEVGEYWNIYYDPNCNIEDVSIYSTVSLLLRKIKSGISKVSLYEAISKVTTKNNPDKSRVSNSDTPFDGVLMTFK